MITETSEARRVVDRMMEEARPLGVDMEGVASDRTGLIQVIDTDRNISLFRSELSRNSNFVYFSSSQTTEMYLALYSIKYTA